MTPGRALWQRLGIWLLLILYYWWVGICGCLVWLSSNSMYPDLSWSCGELTYGANTTHTYYGLEVTLKEQAHTTTTTSTTRAASDPEGCPFVEDEETGSLCGLRRLFVSFSVLLLLTPFCS